MTFTLRILSEAVFRLTMIHPPMKQELMYS